MSHSSSDYDDFIDTFPDDDEFDRLEVESSPSSSFSSKSTKTENSFSSKSSGKENRPRQRDLRNTIYERPKFDRETKLIEKHLIEIIHNQIAASAPRDIETLTDLINEACKNEGDPENIFEKSSQCVEFLSERSFLFEKKVTDKFFRNTGFAHREGLVAITSFIQENSYSLLGCQLKDLAKYIIEEPNSYKGLRQKSRFSVYSPKGWINQQWDDSYFFFYDEKPTEKKIRELLLEYGQYFKITDSSDKTFVGLKPIVFGIPSLWNENLLPSRPTEPYQDVSRIESYLVFIQSATENYVKAEIWAGKYAGRRAFYLSKNTDTRSLDMSKHIPIGNPAFACAFMTMGHKNDLRASVIDPVVYDENFDRELIKQKLRSEIDLESLDDYTSAAAPAAQVDSDAVSHRRYIREMIATEKAQIKFVDAALGNDGMRGDEFMNKVAGNLHLFSRSSDVVEFILERPHLYKQEDDKAFVRPPSERQVYTALFEFLHDIGKEGMKLEQMNQLLKAGVAGEHLQDIVLKGTLLDLLNTIKPFIGKIFRINPVATHYAMLVTFDKSSKILLPHYGNCGPHLRLR